MAKKNEVNGIQPNAADIQKAFRSDALFKGNTVSDLFKKLGLPTESLSLVRRAAKQLDEEQFADFLNGNMDNIALKLSPAEMELLRGGGFWKKFLSCCATVAVGALCAAAAPTGVGEVATLAIETVQVELEVEALSE
jgi:hypothetical protein